MTKKLTVPDIMAMKVRGEKITMMTAYDYPTGLLVEKAGIDTILVGDSLGMTVLGYNSTVPVTVDEMIHHTKAVRRGARNTFIVADMPFGSYNAGIPQAIANASRFLKEGGADAVKLEGGTEMADVVEAAVKAGIPVLGHIGLTPQTVTQLGGYKVQGRDEEKAKKLVEDALALSRAGAFAVVLECIPKNLAKEITERIPIPTIGIGAGPFCDGQVLVYNDVVGLFEKFTPKFVKRYAELGEAALKGLMKYNQEVKEGTFPDAEHSFD
ncbi:MAG: 3-methyl-2-oxobutanoate hydroxymethyltransferase [Clostridia bacterium]|nr:3-methyl-2-oxobutanoate hydroxymethyltransferase [Clostridia bacterium]